VLKLVVQSEYKRRQAAPVLRVTARASARAGASPSRTPIGIDDTINATRYGVVEVGVAVARPWRMQA